MSRKDRRAARMIGKAGPMPGVGQGPDALAATAFEHGNGLARQGRFAEAASHYRRAIAAKPDFTYALANLGNAHMALGEADQAIGAWRRAIAFDPNYAVPHANLGNALSERGDLDEAITHLRRAVELKPDFVAALDQLAKTFLASGEAPKGLQTACRAIAIGATNETKKVFVDCLKHIQITSDVPALRDILVRALSDLWARPEKLIGPAANLAKKNPVVAQCVDRVAKAWPARLSGSELWSPIQRTAICSDPLLMALLDGAPICDLELERFLTSARLALLTDARMATTEPADATVLAFHCALARQCFINEYIFACDDSERDEAERLTRKLCDALLSGDNVPPRWLAAVGCYVPLYTLDSAAALLERPWPPAVERLLIQQIQEPLEEARDRASIPVLTGIEDSISLAVKDQYEEHPYPRWIGAPPSAPFDTFESYLHVALPFADFRCAGPGCDILVAGCGTGQHAIDVARRSRDARVLAIDLSLASISYARRKTRALGIANLEYGQADILAVGAIGRRFDVIESGGVLHHLDDPMAGWRALLALLRPGGFMYLGLYSALARQNVSAVRAFVAERGYQPTAEGIRRFRQDIVTEDHGLALANLLTSPDFFNASGCRDLFFHVQEHQLNLPQIGAFLRENNLKFLGFHLDALTLQDFRRRHPGKQALTDLDLWHVFETENPRAFGTMYQFWIQKPR